ncbi:MAG TPA: hypothetical protein VMJ66_05500 [Geobacteraceae bacterium]|nr:hypothetical protein [Geobacteraceae bacterium]
MKKFAITIVVASLLAATSAVPAFADGWGHHHGGVEVLNPLWPVAAALAIPAAIVGTVARLAVPPAPVYGYAAPPAPVVYERPVAYYPQRVYAAPRAYYGGRVYYPRGYGY